jgi:aminoglycoside phosphotransferase (APT) family kinase protein
MKLSFEEFSILESILADAADEKIATIILKKSEAFKKEHATHIELDEAEQAFCREIFVSAFHDFEPWAKSDIYSTRLGWSRQEFMKVWDKLKIESIRSFLQKTIPDFSIKTIDEKQGDEHRVIEINSTWIFRLPKSLDVCKHVSVEVQLLKALENKITLPIPKVVYYSKDDYIFGYKKIPGVPLFREIYMQLTPAEKKQFANDFAQFLCELHTRIPLVAARNIAVPFTTIRLTDADWPLKPAELQHKLSPKIEPSLQATFNTFIKEYQRIVQSSQPVMVVHNDLHSDNILIDPKTKRLSGIIDFTSAAIDTAYHDFRYLHLIDMKLVALTVQAYNQKTGENLTVRNAYVYCMATEFSRLAEAMEQNKLIKADEIKQRIYELNDSI